MGGLSENACSVRQGVPPVFRDALLVLIAQSNEKNNGVRRSEVCKALSVKSKNVLQILKPIMRLNRESGLWEFKIERLHVPEEIWRDRSQARRNGEATKCETSWMRHIGSCYGLNILPPHAAADMAGEVKSSYQVLSVSAGQGHAGLFGGHRDFVDSGAKQHRKQCFRRRRHNEGAGRDGDVEMNDAVDDARGEDDDVEMVTTPNASELSELFVDALEEKC